MDLLKNPFYMLNANLCDSRDRIMELVLLLNTNESRQASAVLTNPKQRLAAEIAWLPGAKPSQVSDVLSLLDCSPKSLIKVDAFSPVGQVNLMVAGLSRLVIHNTSDITEWILAICLAFEKIDIEELSANINEERLASGFPSVDLSAVAAEVSERRKHYCAVIKSTLDQFYSKELVRAITLAVEIATSNGKIKPPLLLDNLTDLYEESTLEFFNKEEANIIILVDKLRASLNSRISDFKISEIIDHLATVAKNWGLVAQPIQISMKSRELEHNASRNVAYFIRALANDIHSEYDKIEFSKQLTGVLLNAFAEMDDIAELCTKDLEKLNKVSNNQTGFSS